MYDLGLSANIYARSSGLKLTMLHITRNQTTTVSIGSLNPINFNGFKKPEADIDVEDSGYADRAKEPDKDCLPNLLDLMY